MGEDFCKQIYIFHYLLYGRVKRQPVYSTFTHPFSATVLPAAQPMWSVADENSWRNREG